MKSSRVSRFRNSYSGSYLLPNISGLAWLRRVRGVARPDGSRAAEPAWASGADAATERISAAIWKCRCRPQVRSPRSSTLLTWVTPCSPLDLLAGARVGDQRGEGIERELWGVAVGAGLGIEPLLAVADRGVHEPH